MDDYLHPESDPAYDAARERSKAAGEFNRLALGGNTPTTPEDLTLQEAVEVVGLSVKTLYKVAANADTPFYKLRSRWHVDRDKLTEWRDSEATSGTPNRRPRRRQGPAEPRKVL